jgi:hypothetical protein
MTSDVQGVLAFAFDLLEALELVRAGRSALEEKVGNGWFAEFCTDGVHL